MHQKNMDSNKRCEQFSHFSFELIYKQNSKMGNSQSQNCQRGTIFLTFATVLFLCIVNIIALVKKRIDPISSSQGEGDAGEKGQKYKSGKQEKEGKEGEKKEGENKGEQSNMDLNFEEKAKNTVSQKIQEDDTIAVKLLKKTQPFEVAFFPLLILFILNIVTGTCKAFSFVNYFFTLILVIFLNVLKVHHQCCNQIVLRIIFDNLWLLMLFFEIINVWGAMTIYMPYSVQ